MTDSGTSDSAHGTAICVQRVLAPSDVGDMSDMERQMDAEAETMLREWDSNNVNVERETFTLRPKSSINQRRKRGQGHPLGHHLKRKEFPDVDLSKREDMTFDTSAESLDEDARLPLYTICPKTGRRLFKIDFDVTGFDQRNITVKIAGSRLIVHAIQKESADGRNSTTEFCRKIKLPKELDTNKLSCMHHDSGKLVVEAPVVEPPAEVSNRLPSVDDSTTSEPVNVPLIHTEKNDSKTLSLNVQIGCVFKATDVVVKLKGRDRLLVTAERNEHDDISKLSASFSREFYLPTNIEPPTLKAGMTVDGILKVTASIAAQNEITNVRVITDNSLSNSP